VKSKSIGVPVDVAYRAFGGGAKEESTRYFGVATIDNIVDIFAVNINSGCRLQKSGFGPARG